MKYCAKWQNFGSALSGLGIKVGKAFVGRKSNERFLNVHNDTEEFYPRSYGKNLMQHYLC